MLQIQEGPYLQYFCGLPGYKDEPPFEASTMVYFRKRLTAEILGEINELIIKKASAPQPKPQEKSADASQRESKAEAVASAEPKPTENPVGESDKKDDDNPPLAAPENKGTLIVDVTCAPSNIRYPQDLSLLNEGREKLEELIDELYKQLKSGNKPRTYRKNARRDYLHVARKKKKTAKEIRKGIDKQLRYMKRDLDSIAALLLRSGNLTPRREAQFAVLRTLFEQQLFMYEHNAHTVENRIVSFAQPWLRPIVRGKAKAPTEFGTKLDISVADGYVWLEHQSFDAYNEAATLNENH